VGGRLIGAVVQRDGGSGSHSGCCFKLCCATWPLLSAGKMAVDYFHNQCPSVEGLKEGENEAEWIVDLTTQVGRYEQPCQHIN
jgi:hypothetical protein